MRATTSCVLQQERDEGHYASGEKGVKCNSHQNNPNEKGMLEERKTGPVAGKLRLIRLHLALKSSPQLSLWKVSGREQFDYSDEEREDMQDAGNGI